VHEGQIEAFFDEQRHFAPSPSFRAQAIAQPSIYDEAERDPAGWWLTQSARLAWAKAPTKSLEWDDAPFARWFSDGRLNASVSCVDQHVAAGRGQRVAFHWVGEPEGDEVTITYDDLLERVCRAANALIELGVSSGDRVAIYMPMIPEAIVAMLACARLGATHSVIFGGFAADALRDRINDAQCTFVITADGGYRRGAAAALKAQVDDAIAGETPVRAVLVVRRTGQDVAWRDGRDYWWHDVVDRQAPTHTPESFEAEHPLYIMYTSGTTARPKGILHTTGGYLTHVATPTPTSSTSRPTVTSAGRRPTLGG
jgi:acetyl-CoA synthetase